jgi:hypothetical protein
MHDGSIPTPHAVVEFYNRVGDLNVPAKGRRDIASVATDPGERRNQRGVAAADAPAAGPREAGPAMGSRR